MLGQDRINGNLKLSKIPHIFVEFYFLKCMLVIHCTYLYKFLIIKYISL